MDEIKKEVKIRALVTIIASATTILENAQEALQEELEKEPKKEPSNDSINIVELQKELQSLKIK